MRTYLLELYAPNATPQAVRDAAAHAQQAAHELCAEGTSIRYLRSVFVPDDETCFHLYAADSIETLHAAAARAGLSDGRIVEAITATARSTPDGPADEKETART
jgi:muconolactone delta-isomerase